MGEYRYALTGVLPKGMTFYPETGAFVYYARDSDAYRNLSHARKVHWLRVKRWPLWPLTRGPIRIGEVITTPPASPDSKPT